MLYIPKTCFFNFFFSLYSFIIALPCPLRIILYFLNTFYVYAAAHVSLLIGGRRPTALKVKHMCVVCVQIKNIHILFIYLCAACTYTRKRTTHMCNVLYNVSLYKVNTATTRVSSEASPPPPRRFEHRFKTNPEAARRSVYGILFMLYSFCVCLT